MSAWTKIGNAMPLQPFRHILPHRQLALLGRGRDIGRIGKFRFHICLVLYGLFSGREPLAGIGLAFPLGFVIDVYVIHSSALPVNSPELLRLFLTLLSVIAIAKFLLL